MTKEERKAVDGFLKGAKLHLGPTEINSLEDWEREAEKFKRIKQRRQEELEILKRYDKDGWIGGVAPGNVMRAASLLMPKMELYGTNVAQYVDRAVWQAYLQKLEAVCALQTGGEKMRDYSKLSEKIRERRSSQREAAEAVGLSERSFSLKMNGKVDWKLGEVDEICAFLDIPRSEIADYFLRSEAAEPAQ